MNTCPVGLAFLNRFVPDPKRQELQSLMYITAIFKIFSLYPTLNVLNSEERSGKYIHSFDVIFFVRSRNSST